MHHFQTTPQDPPDATSSYESSDFTALYKSCFIIIIYYYDLAAVWRVQSLQYGYIREITFISTGC